MSAPEVGSRADAPTSRVRVVVVDDSAVYRHGIVRALERDPRFAVAGFYDDGDPEALSRCPCDLLLLDYLLQTTTGIDLLEDLRARGVTTPAVLISASLTDELRVEALRIGFTTALDKSLSRAEICDGLAASVGGRPQLRILPGASDGRAS